MLSEVSGTFWAMRKRKTVCASSTEMESVHFCPPAAGTRFLGGGGVRGWRGTPSTPGTQVFGPPGHIPEEGLETPLPQNSKGRGHQQNPCASTSLVQTHISSSLGLLCKACKLPCEALCKPLCKPTLRRQEVDEEAKGRKQHNGDDNVDDIEEWLALDHQKEEHSRGLPCLNPACWPVPDGPFPILCTQGQRSGPGHLQTPASAPTHNHLPYSPASGSHS